MLPGHGLAQQFFGHRTREKCVRLHEEMCATARIISPKCVPLHEFGEEEIVCGCTNCRPEAARALRGTGFGAETRVKKES